MWMPEICKAEDAGEHFTWHSWHCSGIDRKIITKGMGYFSPMRYSELPRFYRDGNAKVDVAMIQVTPMDKHGNFSYALACSHLADMLDNAKTVIVEVNENLPWVYGLNGCEINIADVDMVVEGETRPWRNWARAARRPRSTPQCEPGRAADPERCLPAARHRRYAEHHRLDDRAVRPQGPLVHTEMYVDGFVDMAMAGKITGKHKNLDKGPSGLRLCRRYAEAL